MPQPSRPPARAARLVVLLLVAALVVLTVASSWMTGRGAGTRSRRAAIEDVSARQRLGPDVWLVPGDRRDLRVSLAQVTAAGSQVGAPRGRAATWARFGDFTDTVRTTGGVRDFPDRPVVVAAWLGLPGSGCAGCRREIQGATHDVYLVVDARSGEYLEGWVVGGIGRRPAAG